MKHRHTPLIKPPLTIQLTGTCAAVFVTVLLALPSAAQADCYAEYKAKRDNPLKLHYGVAKMNDAACTQAKAKAALAARLAKDNWILLSIVGFVAQDKLNEVKANAGDYFLRY